MGEHDPAMRRPAEFPFMGLTDEEHEAIRLAEALEAIDEGRAPGIDPREDPQLHELLETATLLSELFASSVDQSSFASFRERSRAAVVHRSERHPAMPAGGAVEEHPKVIPFYRRLFPVLSPLAAAAAAAAVTFMALSGATTEAPAGPQTAAHLDTGDSARPLLGLDQTAVPGQPGETRNLTALTVEEQVRQLQEAVALIAASKERGEPITSDLLRQVAEGAGAVKQRLETNPAGISGRTVIEYAYAAANGKAILSDASSAPGAEGALEAARLTTESGMVTAARFLNDNPEHLPVAATPEPPVDVEPPADAEPVAEEETASEDDSDAGDAGSEDEPGAATPTPTPAAE
jgi:hypothetical protein